MGWWTEHVVPRMADKACGTADIAELRGRVCTGLHGRVLEVGFGSGHNLRHLPSEVESVSAVEPSDTGWALSEKRRNRARVPVRRTGLDGQALAEPDASFDSALVTFSLCTIPDAAAALREVRRVLRPGGRLHFLEHGLAPDAGVAAWQHRLDPVQRRMAGGCHLSRDIPALVRSAGLDVEDVEASYLPGPRLVRPWGYGYLGTAVRPG
jgi:SAM-dependent methyltransferase